jgi:hypothetical protein
MTSRRAKRRRLRAGEVRTAAMFRAISYAGDAASRDQAMTDLHTQLLQYAGPARVGRVTWRLIPTDQALARFDHWVPLAGNAYHVGSAERERLREYLREHPTGLLIVGYCGVRGPAPAAVGATR